MKVGVIGAMKEEVGVLLENMKVESETEIAGRKYYSGDLYGIDTVLVFSRWGKVAASIATTTLITKFNVEFIVFTGVAGAISDVLNIGDVVVADSLVQHDMDARPLFNRFQVPLSGKDRFLSDSRAVSVMKDASDVFLNSITRSFSEDRLTVFNISSPRTYVGTVGSGDQFVSDPQKVSDLRASINGLMCVEMEGAAVAQACEEHNIPFIVVRTISDKADHSAAVDFTQFIEEIASNYSNEIVKNFFSSSFFR